MKIVFAGTPEFAVPTLAALHHSEHEVVAVLSQPDRPRGRGQKVVSGPVKQFALEHGLSVFQPVTLRGAEGEPVAQLLEQNIDVFVVVAYGLIIPESFLLLPKFGGVNIHPSRLPLWRGAAPIPYSILSGCADSAMTLIQMDAGMDTGDILYQEAVRIGGQETATHLHDRMAKIGARCLLHTLDLLSSGEARPEPQDHQAATYSAKVIKAQACIDWLMKAQDIVNRVRAYNAWPVAFTHMGERRLRVWEAQVLDVSTDLPPGTVINFTAEGIDVAVADTAVRIVRVQRPGGKPLDVRDFFNSAQAQWVPGETRLI
jgi:methionyl-tRNA formyltransferase